VKELIPIQNKDRIELAIVDGWSVIVSKGLYKVGDKTIYCEIDSVLPDKPEFEFLRDKHFRIKTMKMAGVISQGICFPLSILPEGNYELGNDVTDIIGITKYESESEKEDCEKVIKDKVKNPILKYLMRYKIVRKLLLPKKQNKGFPEFLSKSGEERIQNLPYVLEDKSIEYVVREKVNGQSGTFSVRRHKSKFPFIKDKYEYIVCSRNLRLHNKDMSKSYWKVSEIYHIKEVLTELIGRWDVEWVAIQGECIDTKVQGNPYKVKEADLYVFNLIVPSMKIPCTTGEAILHWYGIKWCPLIETNFIIPDTMAETVKYAEGKSKIYDTFREGLVVRNYDEKISFKIISNEYLLQNNS
jgi:hypothetical protein